MRRMLYFVLPDIKSARKLMDELLLESIEEDDIHFHAHPPQSLGNLPKAEAMERSDVIYSAMGGFLFGAICGLLGGILAYMVPWWFGEVSLSVIPYCMVLGAILCAIWAGGVAAAAPSYRIKSYSNAIEQGNILMMVSVPLRRLNEIRLNLVTKHPEATYSGVWPAEHMLIP